MDYFAQQAINAVQLGSIYALIALGYSMVYGVLVMINFAHGDVFMVSTFFCFLLLLVLPVPFVAALIIVMLATALLGVAIERLAYRPLRNAPRVSAIITALGWWFARNQMLYGEPTGFAPSLWKGFCGSREPSQINSIPVNGTLPKECCR